MNHKVAVAQMDAVTGGLLRRYYEGVLPWAGEVVRSGEGKTWGGDCLKIEDSTHSFWRRSFLPSNFRGILQFRGLGCNPNFPPPRGR